jgi:hypothetical protein
MYRPGTERGRGTKAARRARAGAVSGVGNLQTSHVLVFGLVFRDRWRFSGISDRRIVWSVELGGRRDRSRRRGALGFARLRHILKLSSQRGDGFLGSEHHVSPEGLATRVFHRLVPTIDEPSGPSLGVDGSMAMGRGEVPGELDKRRVLGYRTHNTNGLQACSWGHGIYRVCARGPSCIRVGCNGGEHVGEISRDDSDACRRSGICKAVFEKSGLCD